VQYGPDSTRVKSTIVSPDSGPRFSAGSGIQSLCAAVETRGLTFFCNHGV
jgi:hypothetical protein